VRAIIIGAGRGSRLMPTTADSPKCFAEVGGQSILDWTLEAFRSNGVHDICFIGGYRIDKVEAKYPELEFRHNTNWQHNNILASLFYAEDLMDEPFICAYSDILFSPSVVASMLENDDDIALAVDTKWADRYQFRTQHPPDDAEKVTVSNGSVTRVHREIEIDEAYGEYIGVAKFSRAGALLLRDYYHQCRQAYSGGPFREAVLFEKAYKILLLQEMIEAGVDMAHVDTEGEYIEIDTQEDFDYARQNWTTKHLVVNHG
jgi:choline kinase